jgi:hypothetical protein
VVLVATADASREMRSHLQQLLDHATGIPPSLHQGGRGPTYSGEHSPQGPAAFVAGTHPTLPVVVLGVDTEWGDSGDGCALVQLALSHRVYLLDTQSPSRKHIVAALRWILSHPQLLKLGFSLSADWTQLALLCGSTGNQQGHQRGSQHGDHSSIVDSPTADLIRGQNCIRQLSRSVVDLQSWLSSTMRGKELSARIGGHLGLSDAVEEWLGRPLDKTEQCSAWCSRPLSPEQISYAALDALVLLDLFHATAPLLLKEGALFL